jgi:MFS family permease
VASRAEGERATASTAPAGVADALPAGPGLGSAVRGALQDAYFHSWRLLPANVLWAVVAVALATAALVVPAAVLLLPLLALPTAGMFRVTTRIVRGGTVTFWDAIDAWRIEVRSTLAIGGLVVASGLVLTANVFLGLDGASPLGWALATLAAWGLVALWLLLWTLWPILTDPDRAGQPVRDRARLAALLVLAHPIRIGALALVLAVFLAASTVAIVALVSTSASLAALVASHVVLPAADRLEAKLGRPWGGTNADSP